MSIQGWFPLGSTDLTSCIVFQETLKSFLRHHSSKASVLQSSASFLVQLSDPHMTNGKAIALTVQTLVSGKETNSG